MSNPRNAPSCTPPQYNAKDIATIRNIPVDSIVSLEEMATLKRVLRLNEQGRITQATRCEWTKLVRELGNEKARELQGFLTQKSGAELTEWQKQVDLQIGNGMQKVFIALNRAVSHTPPQDNEGGIGVKASSPLNNNVKGKEVYVPSRFDDIPIPMEEAVPAPRQGGSRDDILLSPSLSVPLPARKPVAPAVQPTAAVPALEPVVVPPAAPAPAPELVVLAPRETIDPYMKALFGDIPRLRGVITSSFPDTVFPADNKFSRGLYENTIEIKVWSGAHRDCFTITKDNNGRWSVERTRKFDESEAIKTIKEHFPNAFVHQEDISFRENPNGSITVDVRCKEMFLGGARSSWGSSAEYSVVYTIAANNGVSIASDSGEEVRTHMLVTLKERLNEPDSVEKIIKSQFGEDISFTGSQQQHDDSTVEVPAVRERIQNDCVLFDKVTYRVFIDENRTVQVRESILQTMIPDEIRAEVTRLAKEKYSHESPSIEVKRDNKGVYAEVYFWYGYPQKLYLRKEFFGPGYRLTNY